MSREILKRLIDMLSEDEPLSDEIEAIETANKSIAENGTVPHAAINWN